ncbi:MAG: YigZ family protein [Clostridia bacterium]|nr:YigZ family protein [Clostridia bacterium]
MKTIEGQAEAVVLEKKSKFIANIFYVESEEEAKDILNKIKKKYYDSRHNCFAYRIKEGESILQKQSDDGEPSGTAGRTYS